MVTWTTWSLLLCPELPAASDSPVNWTVTWENWPSTWFLSQDCTSSWSDSLPWPQEDPNNTEPWPSLNWPNKCSMPKTWCALLTPDTEDIWLPPLCSEEECPPKKSTNKCWTFKTKTVLTSLSGSPTTSNPQSVIFLLKDWKWPSLSSETQLPSKKCSKELLNNSPLCSEERPSYIGTLVKEWTRWNSLKPNPTWTTWSLNINNIKTLPLKKKTNSKEKKKPDNNDQKAYPSHTPLIIIYIKIQNLIQINSNIFSLVINFPLLSN